MQRYESEETSLEPLASPLRYEFSGKTSRNRFMKAAMSERLASWSDERMEARGVPSESVVNLYRRWGEDGIGLLVTGNVMVQLDHLTSKGNMVVPPDAEFSGERFGMFEELAREAKKHGSLIVAQLSHPGRQVDAAIQPHPVSASAVPMKGPKFGMTFAAPHAASQDEIDAIVGGFAHAAEFLERAGFDGVQLHAAHGFLLAQFLSSSTNQRQDRYGGLLENRARFIFAIEAEIRRRTSPAFILGIKLNSVEFQETGASELHETKKLCRLLEQRQFDFLELSGGSWEATAFAHKRESTRLREAFFIEMADVIAPVLRKTRLYVTGGFKTAGAMARAISSSSCDGIGLARPFCQEPRLCSTFLTGAAQGCIKTLLDANDYVLTNIAAGTQIRQIGKDEEPIDLSARTQYECFLEDLSAWMGRSGDVGFFDIVSAPVAPYGSTAG